MIYLSGSVLILCIVVSIIYPSWAIGFAVGAWLMNFIDDLLNFINDLQYKINIKINKK